MMLRYSFNPKFCIVVNFLVVAYCANSLFAEIDVFFDLIFTVVTLYFTTRILVSSYSVKLLYVQSMRSWRSLVFYYCVNFICKCTLMFMFCEALDYNNLQMFRVTAIYTTQNLTMEKILLKQERFDINPTAPNAAKLLTTLARYSWEFSRSNWKQESKQTYSTYKLCFGWRLSGFWKSC